MIAPYTIQSGITSSQITELISYTTTDEEIQKNTSDWQTTERKPGRFSSLAAFKVWYASGKTIYTLKSDRQNLAGIIWSSNKYLDKAKYQISKEVMETYHTTLGIRLYGAARGKGLAKPFLLETIDQQLCIWLEVHAGNTHALHLYESVGFRDVTTSPSGDQHLLIGKLSGKLSI